MALAVQLAEQAFEEGEIPVGAVVVHEGRVVGKGYNQVQKLNDPTAHAEMIAISAACDTLNNKYLKDCTMYVTLEPCPMCAGALVWSKVGRLVFGASDARSGSCGTVYDITRSPHLNHKVEVIQGILEQDSEYLISSFFEARRLGN